MKNYYNPLSSGNNHKAKPIGSFGERTTTGAVTNIHIWPDGNFLIPPQAGVQMSLVSTSAQDSAAGTGIRTIEFHYIDVNLDEQSLILTMTGTTPVVIPYAFTRFVQCLHAITVGSTYAAVGTITVYVGAQIYSQINPLETRCTSAFRMVPRGKIWRVNGLFGSSISGGGGGGGTAAQTKIRAVSTQIDTNILTYQNIYAPFGSVGLQDGSETMMLATPMPFSEGVVIGLTATSDRACTISGGFFGFEEPA